MYTCFVVMELACPRDIGSRATNGNSARMLEAFPGTERGLVDIDSK